jgi:FlaA1/EpsC-like NDP-sugar epimerase
MLDLAKFISDDVEIVGKRPGEKTNEDLISEREIKRTFIYDDDIHIRMEENKDFNRLTVPYNSKSALKMDQYEMGTLVYG